MDSRINQNDTQDHELVEFESEMPRLESDDVEFVADEQLEDEITEEI